MGYQQIAPGIRLAVQFNRKSAAVVTVFLSHLWMRHRWCDRPFPVSICMHPFWRYPPCVWSFMCAAVSADNRNDSAFTKTCKRCPSSWLCGKPNDVCHPLKHGMGNGVACGRSSPTWSASRVSTPGGGSEQWINAVSRTSRWWNGRKSSVQFTCQNSP